MAVVAIVSGVYCFGYEVASAVAERLDYGLVGGELLEELAEKHGTSVKKLSRVFSGSHSLLDGFTHSLEKSLIQIKAAVAELASRDNVVLYSWVAHLIPREITHVLRVALTAEPDSRIHIATETTGLDAKAAAVQIKKSDQDLANWTEQLFGTGPWDADLYDLKIPMKTEHIAPAVDLICESAATVALKPTERSGHAAEDFLLATRVNTALLEAGHHYCDITSKQGSLLVIIRRKPSSWGQLGRALYALRLDQLEGEVEKIASAVDGVQAVEVQPGSWHKRTAKTLLVDDEQDYVMTLSERLGMRDIPSDIAYDGFEALEFVKTDTPDVMVLDLRMPGMDGIEVLRRVQKDHPNVQVIVVTGHGSIEDERKVRELGAFEYLEKPVDITVLAETIQRASDHAKQLASGQDESEVGSE